METVIKGLLKIKWQPQLQLVRFKNKVNITKPRPPHFQRALVETVCLPFFFKEKRRPAHIPDYESCVGPPVYKRESKENHPLVAIYSEECFNYFTNSKLIAFFHKNDLGPEEKFEYQLLLKKNGMKFLILSYIPLKKALTGTQFESVLPLYGAPTVTVFSPEPDINRLLGLLKKMPKLVLMGSIVENRFLSVTDLQTYGKYKNITEARVQLVSLMNSASQRLVQQINHHPNNLVALLNQHKKVLEDGKS